MKARLVARHETLAAVYSATFSPNGAELVWAGGWWYGEAFLSAIETGAIDGEPRELLRPITKVIARSSCDAIRSQGIKLNKTQVHNLRSFTISGLAFDQTGEWLAASVWGFCQTYYPSMLLRYGPAGIKLDRVLLDDAWRDETNGSAKATGLVFVDDCLWVRRAGLPPDRTLHAHSLPGLGNNDHALANRHIARLGSGVATGIDGSSSFPGKPPLLVVHGPSLPTCEHLPEGADLTAITSNAQGTVLVAGDGRGNITTWSSVNGEATDPVVRSGHDSEITAACHLKIPAEHLLTAGKSGEIRIWDGEQALATWRVPAGSPRTVAAHPSQPLVAVGCKHLGGGPRPGGLFIYELT